MPGHAVIGHNDDIDLAIKAARLQAIDQLADRGINIAQGRVNFRAAGSEIVALVVDRRIVERDGAGTLRRRQVDPVKHLLDAVGRRHLFIIGQPVSRTNPVIDRFRTRPEQRGHLDALRLSGHPQRLGVIPPEFIGHRFLVRQLEGNAGLLRITHSVIDDAMVIGA